MLTLSQKPLYEKNIELAPYQDFSINNISTNQDNDFDKRRRSRINRATLPRLFRSLLSRRRVTHFFKWNETPYKHQGRTTTSSLISINRFIWESSYPTFKTGYYPPFYLCMVFPCVGSFKKSDASGKQKWRIVSDYRKVNRVNILAPFFADITIMG